MADMSLLDMAGIGSYSPYDTSGNYTAGATDTSGLGLGTLPDQTGALGSGLYGTNLGGAGTGGVFDPTQWPSGSTTDNMGNVLNQAGQIIGQLASAAPGMYAYGQASTDAKAAAAAADPFASQRGQYQTMLQQLMTNPNSYNMSPAAQFQMQQGTQNVERSAAAQGYLGSGNILAEIQQYGQGVASQDYWKQAATLEALSGATTGSPAAAGQAMGQIFGNQQAAAQQIGAASGGSSSSSGGSSGGSSGAGIGGALGTIAGSIVGGPVGGAIGDALGGLIGGLF